MYVTKIKCRFYSHDQVVGDTKMQCYNYWEHGYRKLQCNNSKRCRDIWISSVSVVVFQSKENFTLVIFTLLVNIINQLSMPVNTLKISQQSKCGPKGERNHASSRDAKGIGQTVIDPPDEMKTKRLLRRHCCYESRSDGIGKPQTLILFSQSLPSKLVYWMKGTFHTNHNNWPCRRKLS